MNLDDSLRDKTITNGDFGDMSNLAQALKFGMRQGRNWNPLSMAGKEALELIQTHVAKILCGDPNEAKHWNDIASLARLISKNLETDPRAKPSRLAEINAARERAGIKVMEVAQDEDLDGQSDA